MTSLQKVVKYFAIAFAIFLIITIISSILTGIYALSGLLGLKKEDGKTISELNTTNIQNDNYETLEIELKYTNLTIKSGNSFKLDTNNEKINYSQSGKTLDITEESYNWFSNNNIKEMVLYIPQNLQFENVIINAGAGKINIENLNTEKLSFELGAGETEIKNLNVSKNCNIEGGAGKVSILSGNINNLDLDMGVGETNLTLALTGNSEINAGIGALNISLDGNKEDYKIKTDKGLGFIKIDGKKISESEVYGNGKNSIEVDGGIGNINIDFK